MGKHIALKRFQTDFMNGRSRANICQCKIQTIRSGGDMKKKPLERQAQPNHIFSREDESEND